MKKIYWGLGAFLCALCFFLGCQKNDFSEFDANGSKSDITQTASPELTSTGGSVTDDDENNSIATRENEIFSDIIIIDPVDTTDAGFTCQACDIRFDEFEFPSGKVFAGDEFVITGIIRNTGGGSFSGTVNMGLMIELNTTEQNETPIIPDILEADTYYNIPNIQIEAGGEKAISISLMASGDLFFIGEKNVVVIWPNNVVIDPDPANQIAAGIVWID